MTNGQLLSNLMLRKYKSLPLYLCSFISEQNFLKQFHSKSSRRHKTGSDSDCACGDDQKSRRPNENNEGYVHLYKSKGQHLLTNQRVLDAIVRKSNIKPSDTVLEIGPGTGNLTLKLLQSAKNVVSIEIDERMVEILHKRVAEHGLEDKLTVIRKDALKADFPHYDLVVANIPYGISSPLIAKLVHCRNPYRSATLLLQKEFARRLLANPGDSEYNRLAVNVKLVAEVEFVMDVSKRDFLPCPKVDSSVVIIHPKAEVPNVDMEEWWAFTRTCFCKKNKTLGATFKQKKKVMELLRMSMAMGPNSESTIKDFGEDGDGDCDLPTGLEVEVSLFKEKIVEVLKSGGFEDKRPSKLSNEELLYLLSLFNEAGICFHDQAKPEDANKAAFSAICSS